MSRQVNQKDVDSLIDLYFSKTSCTPSILYNHLHFSFDTLITHIIPDIVNSNYLSVQKLKENEVDYTKFYHLKIENINVRLPCDEYENNYITPDIARKRRLSYTITLFADFYLQIKTVNQNTLEEETEKILLSEQIILSKIPCCVKSKFCCYSKFPDKINSECHFDEGGYYILNGNEKVVMTVESPVYNKLLFSDRDDNYEVFLYSQKTDISKIVSFHIYLNSKTLELTFFSRTLCKQPINLIAFLKCLDYFQNDKHIFDMILSENENEKDEDVIHILQNNFILLKKKTKTNENNSHLIDEIYQNLNIYFSSSSSTDTSLDTDTKKKKMKQQMKETLLNCSSNEEKILFIIRMIRHLFKNMKSNKEVFVNKDEYTNKRFETAGFLIAQLFKQQFQINIRNMGYKFQSNNYDHKKLISDYKHSSIDNYINTALKTGTWGVYTRNRKGVSRLLDRLSYLKTFSSLRDIIVTSNDDGAKKNIAMRSVEASQSGFVCVVQTPEGKNVGMTKSLVLAATVTNYDPLSDQIIVKFIHAKKNEMNIIDYMEYNYKYHSEYISIYMNGSCIGYINPNSGMDLYLELKKKKLLQEIHKYTSIVFDSTYREININTQKGRLVRPVLRVNKETFELYFEANMVQDSPNIFDFMLKNPYVIEYIDVMEQQYSLIAEKISRFYEEKEKFLSLQPILNSSNFYENTFYLYDYVEFHPSLLLGMGATTIPYLSMNQSPRNTYHAVHSKQSIGIYNTNYRHRMDTSGNILHNPQLPIVIPNNLKYLKLDKIPYGQNIILAIMCFSGYNQEDSVIMNKSSIEHGLFECVSFKDYESVITKNHFSAIDDINTKPRQDMFQMPNKNNYETLQSYGLPLLETVISKNDAIIGKVAPLYVYSDRSKNTYKDKSVIYKDNYTCRVDNIENTVNADGYQMNRVKLRHLRIPIIGDKYTSRHGQKSTCGIIIDKAEMPVSKEGIVPDIIINPHAIPSRMTIGQILEMLTGKVGALEGEFIDGTPFEEIDMKSIREKLKKHNYREDGYETLYCGITGKPYKSAIYMGPCYYIKLKQLVLDKLHARSMGPLNNITRQPPQGKSKNGGSRMGEMEKDCLLSHGSASFLKERFVKCSDQYVVHICSECGLFASKVKNHDQQFWCQKCNSYNNIYSVTIPYALKLVVQELRSINIGMSFNLK